MVGAGILRDVVAWNPIAHIAHRHLAADREFEADRQAAALTGRPLAVASGLLKMCELSRRGRRPKTAVSLAFWGPGAGVRRRVSNLLRLADGGTIVEPFARAPYLLAALLAVALGLQVAAQMARQDGSTFALVWGQSSEARPITWTPKKDLFLEKQAHLRDQRRDARRVQREAARFRPLPERYILQETGYIAFERRDFPAWIKAMAALARRQGLGPVPLHHAQEWTAAPVLVSQDAPFAVYKVNRLP
jgi:hypothetical protein